MVYLHGDRRGILHDSRNHDNHVRIHHHGNRHGIHHDGHHGNPHGDHRNNVFGVPCVKPKIKVNY